MITCTRRIQFCAGHRVMGHENKCAHPHGHNYVALFEAEATKLDGIGRVIDFSVLKEKIGGWIDENWDHGFLIYENDEAIIKAMNTIPEAHVFIMPINPTAENMARFLLKMICPEVLDGSGVTVKKVTIWETENCFAEATL